MSTERSVTIRLKANVSEFSAAMKKAGTDVKNVGKDLQDSLSGEKAQASLNQLGGLAGRVGLIAAAGFGTAVAAAANFDQALSNVAATGDDARANMEQLRQVALKAGADTAFSATEAAAGIENLAKAGVAAADIISGGLAGSLDLAAAGELDVATAGEIAATTMNQFGLAGEDVTHIADVLAATAGKAQGSVLDMAGALKFVGPVAAQMGISLEETAGSIGYLASQGILGEQAGTSLRGILSSLTSPSAKAAETMARLGISLYDTQGQFIGLTGVADQLQAALGGMSNAQRDATLGVLFGNEQITAARILYAGGAKAIDEWTAAVNDQGYAADAAATRLDNLKGDVEQLKGSLETLFITAGDGSQGPLRDLVQGLTGVTNALGSTSPAIQSVVMKLLAITAVTGGALWFGAKVIGGINNTREALIGLGASADGTSRKLRGVGKGIAILSVTAAISAAADELGRIDTGKLERGIEALNNGETTKTIDEVVDSIDQLNRTSNTVDFGEVITLFGLLGDTSLDRDADNIDALDQALAGLVESGNAAQAADAFRKFSEQAKAQGVSTDEITSAFDDYRTSLKNTGDTTGFVVGETGNLIVKSTALTEQQQQSAAAAQDQAKALDEARDAAKGTAEEFFGLGDKVDDAKTSLSEWIQDLNDQADALANFRKNAKEAAKKGLDEGLIASLQAAGPEGARRLRQLADATDAEIERANRAWKRGQRQIELYTDAVGGVPTSVATTLTLDITGVQAKLNKLEAQFGFELGAGGTRSADGSTVPKDGGSYGDRYPYLLAPGEEVISNRYGQADRFRPLLKAINAGRGLAGGGTVTSFVASTRPAPAMGVSPDLGAALASVATATRPLYGDVYVQPHDYNEFLRQQRADMARASTGGLRR